MGKSEVINPKLLAGEKPVPGIRVDAGNLLRLLLRAEMMMTAVDRRRYCNRAIDACEDVIRDFQMAYDFQDERGYWLRKLWADMAVLMELCRTIAETNAIHIPAKFDRLSPDAMKLEIFRTLGSLDEGVSKWRKSIARNATAMMCIPERSSASTTQREAVSSARGTSTTEPISETGSYGVHGRP